MFLLMNKNSIAISKRKQNNLYRAMGCMGQLSKVLAQ